jgi:hypothetical protein
MHVRGHERLLIVAESMGGAILGQFLARSDRAGTVAAVALDSPAVDLLGVLRNFAVGMGLPVPGVVARVGLRILDWRTPMGYREVQVSAIFADFSGPFFFGRRDRRPGRAGGDHRCAAVRPSRGQRADPDGGRSPAVLRGGSRHLRRRLRGVPWDDPALIESGMQSHTELSITRDLVYEARSRLKPERRTE